MSPCQQRLLPLSTILLASVLAAPAGADVRITGILDGTLSGGTPKAIELYVSGTEDLGDYDLYRSTNGAAFAKALDLSGSYTDEFVYLAGSQAEFEAVFGTSGDFANLSVNGSAVSGNGNDGFQLVEAATTNVVDQVWTNDATNRYTDSYMYRNNGTGPDGGWVEANWTIPGNDVLDGLDASGIGAAVPFGTYEPGSSGGETCGDPFTPIYDIQGSGNSSSLVDQVVSTEGVVIADFEDDNSLDGFYLQDPAGDGKMLTSDGIFVYRPGADDVQNGDLVRVTGKVQEFFGETQISSVQAFEVCGSGTLPSPVQIGQMPFPSPVGDREYLERYEGMYVEFPQELTVTELFQLGRFGQLTLSVDGRLRQFTDESAPDVAGFAAHQEAIALRRIILDDPFQVQNPDPIIFPFPELTAEPEQTVRGGMTVTDLRGVMTYTWGGNSASPNAFRVRPISTEEADIPVFDASANPRPATAPAVPGSLKIVSFNVLNYFSTLDEGSNKCGPGLDQDCRGAESLLELERQTAKTVNAILEMNADVYGLVELENNGTGPGSAIQTLVDAVNTAAGEARYAALPLPLGRAFVDVADVISVGFIYKTATVRRNPGTKVVVLDDEEAAELPVAGQLSFPIFDGENTNRASMGASFEEIASGKTFSVYVNHFKSKGASGKDQDPVCQNTPAADSNCDQLDGQGYWNGRRTDAARALASWIEQDPTASGDEYVFVIGDLNSYAKEDPIALFVTSGYTDLARAFDPQAYSFVFDGQWGYLDYALAKGDTFARVTGAAEWHNNSDEPSVLDYNTNFKSENHKTLLYSEEPFRTSDHDPLIVGIDFGGTVPGDLNGDGLVTLADWRILRDALGTSEGDPGYVPEADLDGDGRITFSDARIWFGIFRG